MSVHVSKSGYSVSLPESPIKEKAKKTEEKKLCNLAETENVPMPRCSMKEIHTKNKCKAGQSNPMVLPRQHLLSREIF